MTDPPDGQKQCQKEAIQASRIGNPTGFQVPAAALGILKSGLHAHPQGIGAHLPPTCGLIGNEEPGFLMACFPDSTQVGLNGLLLQEQHASKPRLTFFKDELSSGHPALPSAMRPAATRMLFADAQQIVPASISTE